MKKVTVGENKTEFLFQVSNMSIDIRINMLSDDHFSEVKTLFSVILFSHFFLFFLYCLPPPSVYLADSLKNHNLVFSFSITHVVIHNYSAQIPRINNHGSYPMKIFFLSQNEYRLLLLFFSFSFLFFFLFFLNVYVSSNCYTVLGRTQLQKVSS